MSFDSSPVPSGIIMIVAGCITVAWLVILATGCYAHWVPLLIGIIVGLWAVGTINK